MTNPKQTVKVSLTERHITALQDAIDAMSNYANLDDEQNKSIDLIADLISTARCQMIEKEKKKHANNNQP